MATHQTIGSVQLDGAEWRVLLFEPDPGRTFGEIAITAGSRPFAVQEYATPEQAEEFVAALTSAITECRARGKAS